MLGLIAAQFQMAIRAEALGVVDSGGPADAHSVDGRQGQAQTGQLSLCTD